MKLQWTMLGGVYVASADGINYRIEGKLVGYTPGWDVWRQEGRGNWFKIGNHRSTTLEQAKRYAEIRHAQGTQLTNPAFAR